MQFFKDSSFSRLIIFGFSWSSVGAAKWAKDNDVECLVFGGTRQQHAQLASGNTVLEELEQYGAEIFVTDKIYSEQSSIPNITDLITDGALLLSLGSPYIIKRELIDAFDGRVINSHGAPLPEHRGGGGFSWRIMANDRRGNSCFHLVAEGIDDGDIVLQSSYDYPEELRLPIQWRELTIQKDSELLCELLDKLKANEAFVLQPQDQSEATYFPRLHTASQAYINWQWNGEEIERFICAFSHPYDGAMTFIADKKITIFDAKFTVDERFNHSFLNGVVIRAFEGRFTVVCNGGVLEVAFADLECDEPIQEGDRMFTPIEYLQEALQQRPRYTASGLKVAGTK